MPIKRRAKKRPTTKKRVPRKIPKMFAAIAEEMQQSPEELAGRIMKMSQAIETQMRVYITKRDKTTKLKSLERRTFGQILNIFKKHSQDQELPEWLDTMREARNDVAHTYFRNTELMKRQFGEAIAILEHKRLRKILHISGICYRLLSRLLKAPKPKPPAATNASIS
jgi:hypothetical protein